MNTIKTTQLSLPGFVCCICICIHTRIYIHTIILCGGYCGRFHVFLHGGVGVHISVHISVNVILSYCSL